MPDVEMLERSAAAQMEAERLHAEKNSPWKSGMYSHLQFEPYQYRAYPQALYREVLRDGAIVLENTVVKSASERDQLGSDWGVSPGEAKEKRLGLEAAVAEAAANRAYTDRNLSPAAKREVDAIDADHEGHLAEVPEAGKRGRK